MANITVIQHPTNAAFLKIALNDMKVPAKTSHDIINIRKNRIGFVQHTNAATGIVAFLEVVLNDNTTYPLEVTQEFGVRKLADPTAQPVGLLLDSVGGVTCTDAAHADGLIVDLLNE